MPSPPRMSGAKKQRMTSPVLAVPMPGFAGPADGNENQAPAAASGITFSPEEQQALKESCLAAPRPRNPVVWMRFKQAFRAHGNITVVETFNSTLLARIMMDHGDKKPTQRDSVEKIIQRCTNDTLEVTYFQKNFSKYAGAANYQGCPKIGRLYTFRDKPSMTNLWRLPRNTVLRHWYHDGDIVNSHPNFLVQAFPDLDFITMRHYAADRRPFFLEYEKATGLPKEICKKSMASIMFGAHNFGITEKRFDRLWRTPGHQTALHEKGIHNREDLICVLSQLDFLRGAQEDMVTVSNAMNERYPELITMLKAAKTAEGKTYSDGTAIHWLLSDMETECLIVIKQALQRRGYLDACGVNKGKLDCIFMYDGIQLPQRNITAGDLDAYMPDLEEAVYESTKRAGLLSNGEGLRIGFMRKPMDEYFPGYDDEAAAQLPCDVEQPEQDVQAGGGEEDDTMVPDEEERRYPDMWIRAYEPRVIEDDLEAANLVIDRHYGRTIMMSDGLILTKHQQGYWMLDGTMVDRYLTALVSDSNFVKEGTQSYSGTTRGASNIRNMLIARMTKLDDPNFIKKLWWACKGKLVFEDGYWDCSLGDSGEFADGHEGLEFVTVIHRKYPRQSNPAVKEEMVTRLTAPTFDSADFKDQLFQFKARALAGHVEDKTFALLKSPLRSSGKTIICKAIRHAFEGYVFEFTSDVLMAGQGCGDGEREVPGCCLWSSPAMPFAMS